jgi:hypothetical protein
VYVDVACDFELNTTTAYKMLKAVILIGGPLKGIMHFVALLGVLIVRNREYVSLSFDKELELDSMRLYTAEQYKIFCLHIRLPGMYCKCFFLVIPFYLQPVQVHLANCVKMYIVACRRGFSTTL